MFGLCNLLGGIRGTGRYILDLLAQLVDLDKEIEYVLFSFEELPLPPEVNALGSRVKLAPLKGPPRLESRYPWYQSTLRLRSMRILPGIHWRTFHRKSADTLRKEIGRQDLDVMHFAAPFDRNLPPGPDCPTKTLYTFLDGIPFVLASDYFDRWSIPEQRLYRMQMAAFRQADHVVAISDCSRNDAVKYFGIPDDRTETVYCGVSLVADSDFAPERIGEAKAKFGLTRPYFLFCSGLDLHKGFDELLDAFSIFQERYPSRVQLAVVGDQLRHRLQEVYEAAFARGLSAKDIRLTGYIDDLELLDLMKGAVGLISPSKYEGFGLPAAKALAIGTPVIAANRGSLPEVVGDAAILVDPDAAEEIVEAMRRILEDEELRSTLIERGLCQARRFDPRERAKDILRAYRELV